MNHENLLKTILKTLPDSKTKTTKKGTYIHHGGENGIIVFINQDTIEIRFPTIKWDCQTPVISSQLCEKKEIDKITKSCVSKLIDNALQIRKSELIKCKYCKELFIPERTIEGDVCHGCASKHLGVVF